MIITIEEWIEQTAMKKLFCRFCSRSVDRAYILDYETWHQIPICQKCLQKALNELKASEDGFSIKTPDD